MDEYDMRMLRMGKKFKTVYKANIFMLNAVSN
jgi:hypothetical protein